MSESVVVSQNHSAVNGKPKAKMSFLARVIGVFFSPGATFEDVARRPTVIAPLLVGTVVFAAALYITMPYAFKDAPEKIENNPQFQALSEEQQTLQLKIIRIATTALLPVLMAVLTVVLALVYWGVGNLMGGEPTFKGMWSVLLFAGMISIVAASALKIPMIILKDTAAGVTFSPALLFGDLAYTDLKYRALAALDLFNLWAMIVTGIGIAKVSRISTGAGIALSAFGFVVVTGILLALGSLG